MPATESNPFKKTSTIVLKRFQRAAYVLFIKPKIVHSTFHRELFIGLSVRRGEMSTLFKRKQANRKCVLARRKLCVVYFSYEIFRTCVLFDVHHAF